MVELLPKEVVRRFPSLHMFFAWALVFVGRLDEAEQIAREIGASNGSEERDPAPVRRAEIASIRSRIAAYRGDHDATIAYATEALRDGSPGMERVRADCLLSLGFAHRAKGMLDEACNDFGLATTLGWTTGFVHAALWGSRYQALTFITRGNLRDAEALIESNMERARETGMDHGPTRAALLVTRGELRYERNDLAGARRDLEDALVLAREVADAKILMNVLVAMARLQFAEGDTSGAIDTAHRATKVFDGTAERALEAWLSLRTGDLATVRRWADAYVALVGEQPDLCSGEAEQLMLSRAMLALGDPGRADAFMRRLLAQAEESGRFAIALSLRIQLAQAADALDDPDAVTAHVREAVDIAMRERYVRSIVDEGPAYLRLLRRAMRHEESRERRRYAASVLAAAEMTGEDEPASQKGSLAEPLTPRQQEVLRLMIEGRSNREIADALYVAEGTVKAHVNQIFGKLMVRNRREAVRAALQLGIGAEPA
jgi:LuxR family maltose regulon positive regulatory protein